MTIISDFFSKLNRVKQFDPDTYQSKMKKCLSTLDLTLLGVGAMVGAGLYILTGIVAKDMAGPSVLISFVIAGLISFITALCYAEFGARVHRTGSAYVYTYVTMGEFWAFLVGWSIILSFVVVGATAARAWSGYFDELIGFKIRNYTLEHITHGPWENPPLAQYPDFFSLVIIFILAIFVTLGASVSSKLNAVLAVLNIIIVFFFICVGLNYADIDNWQGDGGFAPYGFSGVLTGAAASFMAFTGFDIIATSSEEAKTPAISIPIAISVSILVAFVEYFAVSVTLTLMIPHELIETEAPLTDALSHNGVKWAQLVVGIGALFGVTTPLLAQLVALPRVIYAMADDGLLFSPLAKIHPRTQVPVMATGVFVVLVSLLAVFFDLEDLIEFLVISALAAYIIVAGSVLVLRYRPCHHTNPDEIPRDHDREGSISGHGDKMVREMNRQKLDELKSKKAPLEDVGKLKKGFKMFSFLSNYPPGVVPEYTILAMVIFMMMLSAFICYGSDALSKGMPWVVFSIIITGVAVIVLFFILCIHEQNEYIHTFTVPFVPFLPSFSIFCNAFLMMKLSPITWIQFAVWLILGMIVYFAYGIRHSKENIRVEEKPPVTDFILPPDTPVINDALLEQQPQPPYDDPPEYDDAVGEPSDQQPLLEKEQ
ncbi:cationic amino acid transporter 4-like [Saccoglossus kowalevskii]|uniref:Cationic amino acid transporter 4-like n=1 Tax=Saccoglossus kowalevskii TaxID=10224 RepID=A0ABM0GIR9_SACKO|nr:PREDICTED: cationic amino acid transporter 4-like [Saccoglossus kowalevskii]